MNEEEMHEEKDENMEKHYRKAGEISSKALEHACRMIKPGASLYTIAEETENFIIKQGAEIAFPANLSVNNQAAHFTPSEKDEAIFSDKDVIKIDVGAHVMGYIGDNARTIDLSGENGKLTEASEKALENAVSKAKAGINSREISAEIQKTIESYGFKPVRNLSGHLLDQYELHTGYSVTNVETANGFELEEGMRIAIEPFASTGEGYVRESARTEIFTLEGEVLTRNQTAREVIAFVSENHPALPFAERWLAKEFKDSFKLKIALRELVSRGAFKAYPILSDLKESLISQAEHTIEVTKDSCEIITK